MKRAGQLKSGLTNDPCGSVEPGLQIALQSLRGYQTAPSAEGFVTREPCLKAFADPLSGNAEGSRRQ